MSTAAKTLFHFTGKNEQSENAIDTILSILKDGFRAGYCPEVLEDIKNQININENPHIAFIPMICFCDIRLSQIKNHVENYGNYGIGLKKDFTNHQRLNPVHYINFTSGLHDTLGFILVCSKMVINEDAIIGIFKDIQQGHVISSNSTRPINIPETIDPIFKALQDLRLGIVKLSAMQKPVRGYYLNKDSILKSNQYESKSVNFYNEREWRHIPELNEDEIIVQKDLFIKNQNLYNKSLEDKNLLFDIDNDVNYIILNKREELNTFSDKLNHTQFSEYKDLLLTKVRFIEEIEDDY